MSAKGHEVAQGIIAKVFSGRRKGSVEARLSRDELYAFVAAAYEVGYEHGSAAWERGAPTRDPSLCRCGKPALIAGGSCHDCDEVDRAAVEGAEIAIEAQHRRNQNKTKGTETP